MGSIQLTTPWVPISDDLQQACQIPLISVIQPLLPIEPAGEDDGSSGAAPLDAPDISRCHGCLGYINHLCAFERQGWVCSLCGVLNDYAIAANRRYLGGDEARRQLPELCPGPVEAVAPVQEGDQDEGTADIYTAPAAPICIALVDASSGKYFIELTRSALLAGLEGMLPGSLVGLAAFDGEGIALYEPTIGTPCIRHIPIEGPSGSPTAAELVDVLPLSNFLVCTAGEGKAHAAAAIEALAPAPRGGSDAVRRPLGEAVQALLRYLGGSAALDGISVAGARVMVFLEGPPNWGRGSVLSVTGGQRDATSDPGYEPGPFFMDPYFPELTAWQSTTAGRPDGDDASAARAVGKTPSRESNQSGWAAALEAAADLKLAAKELGLSPSARLDLRWEAQQFYGSAGAAAASLGVSIDLFAVSESFIGLELLHEMARASGGGAFLYPIAPTAECTLPQDVYKRLSEPRAFECLLRVRTSPELRVTGAVAGRLRPDPRADDLFHLPCCHAHDAYGIHLQHRTRAGFSSKATPVVQLVHQYLHIVPTSAHATRSNSAAAGGAGSNGTCVEVGGYEEATRRFVVERKVRIVTAAFPVASTVAEVYEHCDAAAHAFALVHQLWAVAGKDGLDAASAALVEATVHLAAAYHEYVTVGEYVANQAAIAVETAARKVDASFRAIEALQQVPRVAYALLRGPLLAGADHPDVPCALRMLWDTLPPHELAPALYPRLSSWISPDEVSFPRHSLSKAALALSRQPIYLLDSYDTLTVYYTAAARAAGVPFPPPAGSRLRAHVRQLQQMRRITPRLLVLCEGEEGPEKAFSKWLIEDDVAARAQGSLTGGAFVQFLQQIEGLVGELLQRGR